MWKSAFEFETLFSGLTPQNKLAIKGKIEKGLLKDKYGENLLCLDFKPKLKGFESNRLFIDIDDKNVDAAKAVDLKPQILSYFVVYVTEELIQKKELIIKDILRLKV